MNTLLSRRKSSIFLYLILLLLFDASIVFILEQYFDHSFAFVPYYRVLIILFSFTFFITDFLKKIRVYKFLTNENILIVTWLLFSVIELIYGFLAKNPKLYLIADFVYILFGTYLFIIVSHRKEKIESASKLKMFSFWLIGGIIFLQAFSFTVSEFFFLLLLSSIYIFLVKKKYLLSLLFVIPFLLQVINSNRSLLVCLLAILVFYLLHRLSAVLKKIDIYLFVGLFFLLIFTFSQELITVISTFIPEDSMIAFRLEQLLEILNKGVDYNNPFHVSIAQRLLEIKAVTNIWLNDFWSFLFGGGLGAVIDGDQFIDKSVTNLALLGAHSIHNIHVLPFALIHKYGFLGILIFLMLIIEVYNSIKKIVFNPSSIEIFWDLCFVLIFIYALPAASFLWTTPFFWMCLAMKMYSNKKRSNA